MILGLVGCGHIGGSLARALRQAGAVTRVIGHDRDPATAERARELGIVDEVGLPGGADVIVLAVPVLAVPACARALAARPEAVVTDVGSTKLGIVRACEELLPRFVGGHPMAGSEHSGPDAADAGLFRGRRVILTPTPRTDTGALATVAGLWRAAGATIVEMDPERHDRVVAAVSHLPHAVAYALCASLADRVDDLRGLSAGGFLDTTRIASTPPAMWIDVFLDNRGPIVELLDRYGAELRGLRDAIEARDATRIEALLSSARAARAGILG